jgi:hypothetical protein
MNRAFKILKYYVPPRVSRLNVKIYKKVKPKEDSDIELEMSFTQDNMQDTDVPKGVLGTD